MKIFVCEFITGGGLYREPLSAALAGEGTLMRDALLRDLAQLPDIVISTSYDSRLPAPQHINQVVTISEQDDAWTIWNECISDADAVWAIAPETDGILAKLTALVQYHNKILLGCGMQAVEIATSKMKTFQILQAASINTVPCYTAGSWPSEEPGPWVAKLDDGVGCGGTVCFDNSAQLAAWLLDISDTKYIIQPYLLGIPASLSILCKQGHAWLLSCNQQKVTLENSKFSYHGSILNGMAEYWPAFEQLANQIAAAIPTLAGYIGVDVIVHKTQIEVLEINPRLTTSYVGLQQAIGCNPAGLVLDLFYNDDFNLPEISRNMVDVSLNA
ncbi:MAG TPA: ATP-grasp domain-containing protein [Methylophilaceae bacterium]